MKFNPTGDVKKNFDFMKENLKAYGYFYSGTRMDEDDVRLVFLRYGTEDNKDNIAYSYARLVKATETDTFREWFARSLKDLFTETEKEESDG
jgi:hypothetical protein